MWSGGRAWYAAALVAAACLAPSAPAAADGCAAAGDRVLAENSIAQVVGHGSHPDGANVFACMKADGVRRVFDDSGDVLEIHRVRLRGAFVAYEQDGWLGEEEWRELDVMDIRSGDQWLVDQSGCARCPDFADLVLRSNGSTAWLFRKVKLDAYGDRSDGRWVVRKCEWDPCLRERRGDFTEIDGHRGVRKGSLRLAGGSRVSWIRAGKRRSASFR